MFNAYQPKTKLAKESPILPVTPAIGGANYTLITCKSITGVANRNRLNFDYSFPDFFPYLYYRALPQDLQND